METAIVILIVGGAAVYCLRGFTKKFKKNDQCGCGCSCESGGTNCNSSGCQ